MMKREGPLLAAMTHRLSECPEDFLAVCEEADASHCVAALIADFFRRYDDANPLATESSTLDEWIRSVRGSAHARYLGILSLAIWLFYDPWFEEKAELAPSIWNVFRGDSLRGMAKLIKARNAIADPDRREELVRICLHGLELRPQGESIAQATDRLMSLNSAERDRILKETAAAEKRAREVREAMAKAKAMESVSRYGE